MSYGSNPSRYLENDVLTRSKEWLVPLLYEHLLTSLLRASVHAEAGELEGKAQSLDRASRIVLELLASLDVDKGGEFAASLASLYSFMAGEIMAAGRTLATDDLQRLIGIVRELHEAWSQAAEQVAPRSQNRALNLASVA